ncbi:MAG: hypothetical protein AAB739_01010 [Patescibacteria group bacterium]
MDSEQPKGKRADDALLPERLEGVDVAIAQPEDTLRETRRRTLVAALLTAAIASPAAQRRMEAQGSEGFCGRSENDDFFD